MRETDPYYTTQNDHIDQTRLRAIETLQGNKLKSYSEEHIKVLCKEYSQ